MDIGNIGSAWAAYQDANKSQKDNAAGKASFIDAVRQADESSSEDRIEQYVEHLKERFGANVYVQNVGNDQHEVDRFGASIAGFNNVAIAPNILEKMANDPKKAAYYEQKIQDAFDSLPRTQAELSMMGFELQSYAVAVDENGVVYKLVTGDLKPEVRAKIEAQIKAEQAAKQARREMYLELSEEAAEKRRELAELQYQKNLLSDALQKSSLSADASYHFVSQPQVSAAAAAYESAISTYSSAFANL